MDSNLRDDLVSELCNAYTAAEMVTDHLRWVLKHVPKDSRLAHVRHVMATVMPRIQDRLDFYAEED